MATYKIDPAHSDISFRIRHMMISHTSGKFLKFDATMDSGKEDFSDATIQFEADVDSITTGNEQRDQHLQNDDFFNADKFPKITFKSTDLKKINDEEYKLTGDLTIRDVTKKVELDVINNGQIKDPWGNERVGFEMNGKINRQEYGLKWNALTETGGLVAGNDVKLHINAEMIKQPEQ